LLINELSFSRLLHCIQLVVTTHSLELSSKCTGRVRATPSSSGWLLGLDKLFSMDSCSNKNLQFDWSNLTHCLCCHPFLFFFGHTIAICKSAPLVCSSYKGQLLDKVFREDFFGVTKEEIIRRLFLFYITGYIIFHELSICDSTNFGLTINAYIPITCTWSIYEICFLQCLTSEKIFLRVLDLNYIHFSYITRQVKTLQIHYIFLKWFFHFKLCICWTKR